MWASGQSGVCSLEGFLNDMEIKVKLLLFLFLVSLSTLLPRSGFGQYTVLQEFERLNKEFERLNKERRQQSLPQLDINDFFDIRGDDWKKKLLKELAGLGMGFDPARLIEFDLVPERWDLIDDPTTAVTWALGEWEPLPAKAVEVLEATFPDSTEEAEQFRIAALLYRYGRESGQKYLLAAARENGNADAVEILALNQEPEVWPALKARFDATPEPDFKLLRLLGLWAPEATELLSEGFRASRGSPPDYGYVLTLADHEVDAAMLKWVQQVFRERKERWKAFYAGTLIHLDPANPEPREYLIQRAQAWPTLSSTERSYVLKALVEGKNAQATVALRLMARGMINEHLTGDNLQYVSSWSLINAALLLLEVGTPRDHELVMKLAPYVFPPLTTESPRYSSTDYILMQAILNSNLPEAEKRLATLIKHPELIPYIKQQQKTQQLRRLPKAFLPTFTQNFVRTRSHWRGETIPEAG